MRHIFFIFHFLLLLLFSACSSSPTTSSKTVSQTIPITMANLRGHRSLYKEGWFVISSSQKALAYAKKHGVKNAGQAYTDALDAINKNTKTYKKDIVKDISGAYTDTKQLLKDGTAQSAKILVQTQKIVDAQVDYASKNFSKAWSTFIKGNISLSQRTKADRQALRNMPGHFFDTLKGDFSNLGEIASSVTLLGGEKLSEIWEDAFTEAKESFLEAYKESGESENSLIGLLYILEGYFKALYHGIASPTSQTLAKTAYHGTTNLAKLVFLPIGGTISVVGRSVESLGLSIYHVSSMGIKFISPTVEAGFLSAMSFLSLGSTGITYVGGGSLGLINQIGTATLAPVIGVGKAVGKSALDTAKVITFVSYDVIKGSSKIFINEAASGVVLGYNALTALPTHLLLSASDSVFFLAWDGPRLVIASAKGELSHQNISKLPVGSVIDLKKLKKAKGMQVDIISKDYKVIEKVLHTLPQDMRIK